MARFKMDGLDDIVKQLDRMGQTTGEVAQGMLMVGAEQVADAWQRAMDENDHRVTGDMIRSIGYARTPKKLGDALAIDIYPQGKDANGVRNAEKAFILHYGSSKLKGSRWLDRADEYNEETVMPAMQDYFDKHMKG